MYVLQNDGTILSFLLSFYILAISIYFSFHEILISILICKLSFDRNILAISCPIPTAYFLLLITDIASLSIYFYLPHVYDKISSYADMEAYDLSVIKFS